MKLRNVAYAAVIAVASAALVLGSAGSSEAKGKKKMAAPPPPPPMVCPMVPQVYAPVCAVKGGMKFTYANSCFAAKDGAKVVSQGACKPKAAKKAKAKAKKK